MSVNNYFERLLRYFSTEKIWGLKYFCKYLLRLRIGVGSNGLDFGIFGGFGWAHSSI